MKARELEMVTHRAQNLGDRRDAFEQLRDAVAEQYRAETGDPWRPRRGSHVSQTGKLTSAAIDARDFMRRGRTARPGRTCPRAPWSPSPAASTSPTPAPSSVTSTRSAPSTKTSCWCTAAAPASRSSQRSGPERNGIHQVVCKPDWNRHGRAAPFRRNDELLNLLPKGVLAFPGSGITDNLVDKATSMGIPVHKVAA